MSFHYGERDMAANVLTTKKVLIPFQILIKNIFYSSTIADNDYFLNVSSTHRK